MAHCRFLLAGTLCNGRQWKEALVRLMENIRLVEGEFRREKLLNSFCQQALLRDGKNARQELPQPSGIGPEKTRIPSA